MSLNSNNWRLALASSVAIAALMSAAPAAAQAGAPITVAAQPLSNALKEIAGKSGVDILFSPEAVRGLRSRPVRGAGNVRQAVQAMIADTPLEVVDGPNGGLVVRARALAPPARAQQSDPAPAAVSTADDTPADIVVTAAKRSERLQQVAGPVAAITGETLQRTQARRLEDYATKIPGVNFISSGEGTTQLIIRGITSGATQMSSTVAVYIDDTPYNSSTVFAGAATGIPDLDPSDIERVEVLKGPQGTLYGADALGGVLKFVTKTPDSTAFSGRIQGGGVFVDGGGSGYNASAALNLPLVRDRLAVRVSGFSRLDPGFIDDPARHQTNINDARVYGGRVALWWKPADNLTIRASALLQNLDADNPAAMDVRTPSLAPSAGDLNQSRYFDGPKRYRYRVYNGTATLALGGVSVVSSTSYATFRETRTEDAPTLDSQLPGFLGARVSQPVSDNKFTQELRLQSDDSARLEWRVGGFYTHETSEQTQAIDLVQLPSLQLFQNYARISVPDRFTEYAVFGDITYHFTPRFDITVGGRFSHNSQDSHEQGFLPGSFLIDAPLHTADDSFTWLFNPRFKLSTSTMIYARASSAYRPGGPTTIVPGQGAPTSFGPDRLYDYEVGLKGSYFDRLLTVDISAFHIDWHDIQLTENRYSLVLLTNGGRARSDGIEASLTLAPVKGLSITAGGSYTDAHLTEDTPGAGAAKGDRIPGTPRWNYSVDGSYDWSFGGGWSGAIGGSYRHVGDRVSDFTLNGVTGLPAPRFQLGSYDVVDLRAGLGFHGWSLTAYVKNVGDARGILALAPLTADPTQSPYTAAVLQPRTFGLDLAVSF